MYTLLADRLHKAERRHDRPAIIAHHMRIALEYIIGTALVIGGNVVAWYACNTSWHYELEGSKHDYETN